MFASDGVGVTVQSKSRSTSIGFPSLERNVAARFHGGLYLLLQQLRRRPVGQFMRQFQALEQLPPHEYSRWLQQRLTETLESAWRWVPYYSSERWRTSLRGRDFRDIDAWPVLERRDLSGHFDELRARGPQLMEVSRRSSATTGGPVNVAMHPHAAAWMWAWEYHVMQQHGVPLGAPTLVLWGGDVKLAQDWVRNRRSFSTTHLTPQSLNAAARAILSGRFPVLWTYPSAAFQLARQVAAIRSGPRRAIPYIKVGGEPLFPFQRQEIERELGGRVVNFYGASEVGPVAAECPAGSMHVVSENIHLEIFNGDSPAPAGKHGDIVITALTNPTMPLVRYRLGDRARLSHDSCACGWRRPILLDIQARAEEVFRAADGVARHSSVLLERLSDVVCRAPASALRQLALGQRDEHRWTVLVEGDDLGHLGLEQELRRLVREHAGTDVDVEVQWTSLIPRERSGKFRYYRSLALDGQTQAPVEREDGRKSWRIAAASNGWRRRIRTSEASRTI